ncbi:MAG: DUF5996 family protein [Acidimicrobiales bacterium]
MRPPTAGWVPQAHGSLAILRFDDVRSSPDPKALLEFLQSAFEAGASLAGWDQADTATQWCPVPPTGSPADLHDETLLRLALLGGLVELGWNKALDAVTSPNPKVCAQERVDLDWWIAQARFALDAGRLEHGDP